MNNEEIIESVKTNIVNRLSSNSSSSRYQGCIISHQSIIGHKRRPMLVIDAKFMGDETVRITALPITSTPFSCDEGFAIIFNNTISIALFAPETIEMGCSELKRYQKNRLAPTEFVDCINCLHKFLIHDPSISTYLLERLLNFSKITEIYNKSNHYSSDNSVGIKLGEKIPNIQPIENKHNKTNPKVVKDEEKPKTTKSKLINKDDDKYKSPNVKTFKEAVNLLEILSMYDSIKGCWKLRYFRHAYMTFYNKVQKAITIIETEVEKNPDIRLNNSIKSVMSEFKIKKRN